VGLSIIREKFLFILQKIGIPTSIDGCFIDTQKSPKHKVEFDLFKLIFLLGVGQNRESTTFQLKAKNSTLKHCHSIQGFDSLNSAH
jgi:hypothetical protein